MNINDLWLLTYTNKHFDLRNPNAENIDILDISQSLSRLCRFTGHCDPYYSVADHVLNGIPHVPPHLVKYWVLHDVEEAYLGDIPTPLKKFLGEEFKKIQQAVHKAVCERFNLPLDFDTKVKRNDLRMLLAEREALFDVDFEQEPWAIDLWMKQTGDFIPHEHVKIHVRNMDESKQLLFEILKKYE